MLIWGWRIPFCLAFGTAILGYWLRAGLPEPKAFLNAARAEKEAEAKAQMADGQASAMHTVPSAKRCGWGCLAAVRWLSQSMGPKDDGCGSVRTPLLPSLRPICCTLL